MRNLYYCTLACFLCLLTGCLDQEFNGGKTRIVRYSINEPLFMSADVFRSSVKVTDGAVPIDKTGKICFYEDYLFISSPEKGIHIVDNRNPSSPKQVGYIELIGNRELAIRDHKLYADSYVDLVWFDLANPAKPVLGGRLESVFRYALPSFEKNYGYDYNLCFSDEAREKGVIVGWEVKEREREVPDGLILEDMITSPGSNTAGGSKGVNGSMSSFSIHDSYLYAVDKEFLNVFDLSGDKPVLTDQEILLKMLVETLFCYDDKLFMGTPTGMMIYSLETPQEPRFRSMIGHVLACDPVVVEGDKAYVTIHFDPSNGFTRPSANQLMVYDISDIDSPKLIVSYAMKCPKGLGIDNNTLFVCDDGLQIFDAKDPATIKANRLVHYTGMDGYDVIPYQNTLIMIANDGIYQYDYSDLQKISLLSKLPIGK